MLACSACSREAGDNIRSACAAQGRVCTFEAVTYRCELCGIPHFNFNVAKVGFRSEHVSRHKGLADVYSMGGRPRTAPPLLPVYYGGTRKGRTVPTPLLGGNAAASSRRSPCLRLGSCNRGGRRGRSASCAVACMASASLCLQSRRRRQQAQRRPRRSCRWGRRRSKRRWSFTWTSQPPIANVYEGGAQRWGCRNELDL